MAGSDTIGPAYPCLSGVPRGCVSFLMPAGWVCHIIENCQLELDEGIAVVGEYSLRRRTAVIGKMRVPTP
jgi:hypothetical protein